MAISLKASSSSRAPARLVPSAAASSADSSEPWRRRMSAAVFSPTPRAPGQPVGGIAAQCDEVGHQRRGHAVAALDLGGVDELGPAARGQQHLHAVAGALEEVAVAGEDQRLAAGPRLGRGVGAEQVVGLDAVVRGDLPAERAVEAGAFSHWCASSGGIGGRWAW